MIFKQTQGQKDLFDLRQLISNFSFLTAGEGLSKLLTFAAFTILARVFGPADFGTLEFTLAFMVFFNLFVDLGTSPFGAREIARNRSLLKEIITLRFITAVIGYVLLAAIAFRLPEKQASARPLLLIYGLTLFGIPGFFQWIFQGLDQMKWVALGSIIRQTIFAVGVFLLIRHPSQLLTVAVIECCAVAGFVTYNVLAFRLLKLPIRLNSAALDIKGVFEQSLPIGLSELTWASTWYAPTVLVGFLLGATDLGWFSAALRPVMTLHTFVWLYFYNLLPSLSRYSQNALPQLQHLVRNSIKLTAWAAMFVGICGVIIAAPMMTILFGKGYVESIRVFRILIWMIPIALMNGHYRYLLIAMNLQKYEFIASLCTAVASILFSMAFIPRWKIEGAAAALLIAALINSVLAYAFVKKSIAEFSLLPFIMKPAIAGSFMIGVFLFLQAFQPWLAIAASICVYGISFFLLQPDVFRFMPQQS
ncbi:MAG: hypothetical protein C5B54_11125 [Acidobacteria bacterium]|nr:MAG: hypothetical protein C5B54_11125 [Acidobacteriota bacterium]